MTAPEGSVIEVDPQTGDKLGDFDSGDRVAVSPIIADTLFLLHQNGIVGVEIV